MSYHFTHLERQTEAEYSLLLRSMYHFLESYQIFVEILKRPFPSRNEKFAIVKFFHFLIVGKLYQNHLTDFSMTISEFNILIRASFNTYIVKLTIRLDSADLYFDNGSTQIVLDKTCSTNHIFQSDLEYINDSQKQLIVFWQVNNIPMFKDNFELIVNFCTSSEYKFDLLRTALPKNILLIRQPIDLKEIQGSSLDVVNYKAKKAYKIMRKRHVLIEDTSFWLECVPSIAGVYVKNINLRELLTIAEKFDNLKCYYQKTYTLKSSFATKIFPVVFYGTIVNPRGTNGMSLDRYFLFKGKTFAERTFQEILDLEEYKSFLLDLNKSLEGLVNLSKLNTRIF
jgi:inosine/xanthosine triphosphate pyrophosphatase family protein